MRRAQGNGLLDDIFQLSDVPGPVVLEEGSGRPGDVGERPHPHRRGRRSPVSTAEILTNTALAANFLFNFDYSEQTILLMILRRQLDHPGDRIAMCLLPQ